MINLP